VHPPVSSTSELSNIAYFLLCLRSYLDDAVVRWAGRDSVVHAVDLNCRIAAALVTTPTTAVTTNPLPAPGAHVRTSG
jgi:hypothetical protein